MNREDKLIQTEEDCLQDLEAGKTRSENTLEILIGVANSLTKYLKFTGETSVNGSKVPVLDTKIWMGESEASGHWYKNKQREEPQEKQGVREATE